MTTMGRFLKDRNVSEAWQSRKTAFRIAHQPCSWPVVGGFLPLRSPLEVLRLNMFFQLVLLAIGLMLVAFPRVLDGDPRQRHFRRLEELKNGADEAFFEERRALETYQPRGYWQTRVLGGLLIFIALSKVLFDK